MRISWITQSSISPSVVYGTVSGKYEGSANGTSSSYHYLLIYRSGQINDVVIGPLKPNTVYYYKCGGPSSTQEFSFRTPPSKFPIKFAVSGIHSMFPLHSYKLFRLSYVSIDLCHHGFVALFVILLIILIFFDKNEGDLGTSEWSKSTLEHVSKWDYDVFILPGDLSYANMYQPLWDTFGRLVQPLASQRPWMVTHGNHELEKIPILHSNPFTAYNKR